MKSLNLSSNKKGQVGNLAPAILALTFAAIVLVFGIVMNQELRDVDGLKNSKSITNESNVVAGAGPYINNTGYRLSTERGEKTEGFVITSIWAANDTYANIILPTGNYTINSETAILRNATENVYDSTTAYSVNVSYTYLSGEEAWDAGNKTVSGLGTFADFWEIIVLAVVITVVIGLLIVVFGRKRSR